MSRIQWRKALKVGKTDRYGLDVTEWANGEAITNFNVIAPGGSGLVITDKTNANGLLSCLISGGISAGFYEIEFTYETADRDDCQLVRLKMDPACATSAPVLQSFISPDGYLISDGYLLDDAYLIEGV